MYWQTTFEGTVLSTGLRRANFRKRKLHTDVDNNVFESYSSLCSNNAGKHRMVDLPWTSPVSSFCLVQNNDSEVFRRYTELYATGTSRNIQHVCNDTTVSTFSHDQDPHNAGPFVSNHRKRTVGQSQIIPTPAEASTSKRARRFLVRNSTRSRVNTEGCSSATAVGRLLFLMLP
ncbi:hypothetical protein Tco_1096066 [Tanacetum coccineum]